MATGPLIEEVATNLEEAAAVTRSLNTQGIGFFVVGVAVGVGIGFYFGYRWNKEKIRAEIFKDAEKTIADIREVYRSTYAEDKTEKPVLTEKPDLGDVVEERGYLVEEVKEEEEFDPSQRPLRPPVPVDPTKRVVRTEEAEKEKDDGWNYTTELAQRGPIDPYIIHQDEYSLNETGYSQTTYTYYSVDDILADTDDSVLGKIDMLVGLNNLTRFGHGTDDFNVLYIRNPKLELEIEICRINKSYAEEVQGLEHSDSPDFERMPRRRVGFDDDNEE
jgi:hypothetical protein